MTLTIRMVFPYPQCGWPIRRYPRENHEMAMRRKKPYKSPYIEGLSIRKSKLFCNKGVSEFWPVATKHIGGYIYIIFLGEILIFLGEMGVSMGFHKWGYPQTIHFNRFFHDKRSMNGGPWAVPKHLSGRASFWTWPSTLEILHLLLLYFTSCFTNMIFPEFPKFKVTHIHTFVHTFMHACMHENFQSSKSHTHTYIHPCMHACMLTWIRACVMHAYVHTCIHPSILHTWIRAYVIHAYVHTCVHACMHTRIHSVQHTCTRAYVHPWIRACIYANMHMCIRHTCMRAYLHAYVHMFMHASRSTKVQACLHPCIHPW